MTNAQYISGARTRYTRVAMWLHWLIAIAIVYNLASGLMRPILPRGFFIWHISSGITILVLSAVRVAWRLTHKPPSFLPMKPWEARLAHVVHFLLYCAMILLPLSGWAMVSTKPPAGSAGATFAEQQRAAQAKGGQARGGARGPTMLWSIVKLPLIEPIQEVGRTPDGVARQHALHERIEAFHLYGAWMLLTLLLIHVGGALKHQFGDGELELARMGLGRVRRLEVRAE